MVLYVTFNDAPSGIYNSQVIDVVNCWNTQLATPTKLVAFVSVRNYFSTKHTIYQLLPEAVVAPMFPTVKLWKLNMLTLLLITLYYNPKTIVARSVYATNIALLVQLLLKKIKVVYDGRGAIAAEVAEYSVGNGSINLQDITRLEQTAITKANYRLSVSNALVNCWQTTYGYNATTHVVIPCTVDTLFLKTEITPLTTNTIQLVYAGSLAGWQSVNLVQQLLINILVNNPTASIIFLSDAHSVIIQLQQQFGTRVTQQKVAHNQVPLLLQQADYGLLFREKSTTNTVASPVKFGEYLTCGLQVIISNNIGDCSAQVLTNNLGVVVDEIITPIVLTKPTQAQRTANRQFALKYYSKNSAVVIANYKTLLA